MAILEVMNKHKLNLTTMVEVELHDVIVWEASRICHAPISWADNDVMEESRDWGTIGDGVVVESLNGGRQQW